MRRRASLLAAAAALMAGGCIPQVEREYRDAHPPLARPGDTDAPPPADQESPRRYVDGGEYRAALDDRPPPPAPGPAVAARPVWEARPATPDARTVAAGVVVARAGDTLTRIADRTGAAAGAIARANDLSPPYRIEEGQRLQIPGGRYHQVRVGEAGIAIARAYGVPWSQIVAANDLTEPFVLRVGERILIPGTPPASSRAAERAAAFTLDVDDILTGGEPAPPRALPRTEVAGPARTPTPARPLPPTALVSAPPRLRGGFAWPVEGRIVRRFGPGGTGQRNDGITVAAPVGTPVRAAADGIVAYVGDGIAALGGLVIVRHGDGWSSVYGYASRLLVQRGQSVRQGQPVALSGETGFTDRPAVHFELRRGRSPVDPIGQLPRR